LLKATSILGGNYIQLQQAASYSCHSNISYILYFSVEHLQSKHWENLKIEPLALHITKAHGPLRRMCFRNYTIYKKMNIHIDAPVKKILL